MNLARTYIYGFLLPVPKDHFEEYRRLAERAADDLDTELCRRFDETAIFARAS
jgi:uncharacterized protein YbaA (DUF1428 family)